MVHEIEEHLMQLDPAHAAIYEANAAILMTELDDLTAEIDAELAPVKGKGYVVFHDAYQYFETGLIWPRQALSPSLRRFCRAQSG